MLDSPGGSGEDVPDGQDPQRRPGGPRRRRQDLAGRGPRLRRRRHNRLGKVEDGTTVCDFDPEEQRRRISVSLALAPFELDGHKVNVLDTPGYADFIGDVAAALQAADLALFVVSAVEGVEVQTESRVEARRAARHPARDLHQQARPRTRVVPAHARPAEGALRRRRRAVATAHRRGGRAVGRRRAAERHRGHLHRRHAGAAAKARSRPRWRTRSTRSTTRSIEGIVIGDDDLMERYLERREDRRSPSSRTRSPTVSPARRCSRCCAAARRSSSASTGSRSSSSRRGPRPRPSTDRRSCGRVQDDRRPLRRPREPLQGVAGHGQARRRAREHPHAHRRAHAPAVHDARQGAGHRHRGRGGRHRRGGEARRHSRPATCSRPRASSVDVEPTSRSPTRCSPSRSTPRPRATRTSSRTRCTASRTKTRCCASSATRRPTRRCSAAWARRTCRSRSRSWRASSASRSRPKTCRSRTARRSRARPRPKGKLKKQTGGHGQFGVAWLRVEPTERGAGIEFVDAIVGGVIPRQFIPAVEKGVTETEERAARSASRSST